MIFGKKYKITAQKKSELEKELEMLITAGRKEIADKLDFLRGEINSEEDDPFGEILQDKNYLETRIIEIKDILNNCTVVTEGVNHNKVEIGSWVKVAFEDFVEEFKIVSSLEADPENKKISDESPVGKSILNKHVGDLVDVKLGKIKKRIRVLQIN